MEENELKKWHELLEKVVTFTSDCSEDIKPYIVGQIEALAEILRGQIDFDQ